VSVDADGWVTDVTPAASGSTGRVLLTEFYPPYEEDAGGEVVHPAQGELVKAEYLRIGISDDPAQTQLVAGYVYEACEPEIALDDQDVLEPADLRQFFLAERYSYPHKTTTFDHPARLTTSYDYTFFTLADHWQHARRLRLKTRTVTHPAIPVTEGGTGEERVVTTHFRYVPAEYDGDGLPLSPSLHYADWTRYADGTLGLTVKGESPATKEFGKVVYRIRDVRTDVGGTTPEGVSAPSGWANPAGAHLTTAYHYRANGELDKVIHPDGSRRLSVRLARNYQDTFTVATLSLSAGRVYGDDYRSGPISISMRRADGHCRMSARGTTLHT